MEEKGAEHAGMASASATPPGSVLSSQAQVNSLITGCSGGSATALQSDLTHKQAGDKEGSRGTGQSLPCLVPPLRQRAMLPPGK